MMDLRITFDFDLEYSVQEYQRQIRAAFDDELLDIADELQRTSPVGATGELKAGWDVIPTQKVRGLLDVKASIVNNADAAGNRIFGRGPGKFPPISPIQDWVEAKLNVPDEKKAKAVAFLVARKIAAVGTLTYVTKKNFAGLNADGSFQADSPLAKAEARIQKRLSQIKLVGGKKK